MSSVVNRTPSMLEWGASSREAKVAVLAIHGRGQTPESMKEFSTSLSTPNARFFAPSAENASWYPHPFLEPLEKNQPELDRSLALIPQFLSVIASAGYSPEKTVLWGFSQGACLLAHYLAMRHFKCGAAILLTGGYIGPNPLPEFRGLPLVDIPILMRTVAEDPWVPQWRVEETAENFSQRGAKVDLKVAPGAEHIITKEAFAAASELINSVAAKRENSFGAVRSRPRLTGQSMKEDEIMSLEFNHESLGQRVLFGSGKASDNLAQEIKRIGGTRVMVIAAEFEQSIAEKLTADLEIQLNYSDVVAHVPIETAEKARQAAREHDIDLIVSIGGGSTTGLAKAIALTDGIPIIAVPTTYAGSEATNVWGLTEAARKTTGVDNVVLPRTVIYDAALTVSLPVELSIASGLNGMAHCIDSMWAPRADPINQAIAAEGLRALAAGLPVIKANGEDLAGREQALYGAYLAAVAFASAGSGLHHKICHVLGGTYNLPHAQTHAVILPRVVALNGPFAPEAMRRIGEALGSNDPQIALNNLYSQLEAPRALKDFGYDEQSIQESIELILPVVPESNPRHITADLMRELLESAWSGKSALASATNLQR